MRSYYTRTLLAAGMLGVAVALVAVLAGPRVATSTPNDDGPVKRYIVVLQEPPLALYTGGIKGLAPTAVEAVRRADPEAQESVHLNVSSPEAIAYTNYLLRRQEEMIDRVQAIAPEFSETDWQYQRVLNGFVAQLTPRHAEAVRNLRGVRLVHPAEELVPEMDSTIRLLGAQQAWEAAGGLAEAGAGARLGTLEAGNAVAHPFFNDEGMPEAPAGWPQAQALQRDGTVTELTNTDILVNKKVLGFKVIGEVFSQADLNTINNGLTVSGHGSHVAGTMTGRYGSYEIQPGITVDMAGIAPMAHLFTYPVFGATPEMIKAFEIMVEDEIDAVNLSLGTTTWLLDTPEMHPVALAMSGASEAGLVVVGSAGNAGGNGRTSLSAAWKYHEDVIAVGNTTSIGTLGFDAVVQEENAPEALKQMVAGLVGQAYTETIRAEAVYRDDGGCSESDTVDGKIAVIERFDSEGGLIGPCPDFVQRAANMAASGAVAVVYVYYDRLNFSTATQVPLPAVVLGARDGTSLVSWLKAGNTATLMLDNELKRGYHGVADYLASSSSRGPGLDWSIKPDISAPGTSIISSVLTGQAGQAPTVATWPAFGGTSMSAPHIAGAAGLLRSIHPDWTARQVKAALLTTASPSVITGAANDPQLADPTEGGVGRLDLTDAWDPRAFLNPPKLSFGKLAADEEKTIEVAVESATSHAIRWEIAVETGAGDGEITPSADSVTVKPGETGSFSVTFTPNPDSTTDEHWGYVVLTETAPAGPPTLYLPALAKDASFGATEPISATVGLGALPAQDEGEDEPRTLRLAYFAYVDLATAHKDVMIINWTYGNTEDYTSYYTDVLDGLGMTYTVWGLGEAGEHEEGVAQSAHPPYKTMMQHDMVILNSNMSPRGLQQYLAGQFQYQNYILGGGNLLLAGQGNQGWWRFLNTAGRLADTPANRAAYPETFPHAWAGPSQNVGCEMCIARYFAGYTPGYTATLSGRMLVPFPTAPDEPEMEVLLAPHADADTEAPFSYSLDISTGAMAKDGAAGNQYRFNSGQVARDYIATASNDPTTPALENQLVSGLGDVDDAEGVMERYSKLAMPLWSYQVMTETMVVGTYIAGKHHPDAKVPWNAMYWGFGLEGVGKGGDETVGRDRLLGDTFNFLARNMSPKVLVQSGPDGAAVLRVDLGPTAAPVRFTRAEIDWGDGRQEVVDFARPTGAPGLTFRHTFAATAAERSPARIKLLPETGTAAPVYLTAHVR